MYLRKSPPRGIYRIGQATRAADINRLSGEIAKQLYKATPCTSNGVNGEIRDPHSMGLKPELLTTDMLQALLLSLALYPCVRIHACVCTSYQLRPNVGKNKCNLAKSTKPAFPMGLLPFHCEEKLCSPLLAHLVIHARCLFHDN